MAQKLKNGVNHYDVFVFISTHYFYNDCSFDITDMYIYLAF